MNTTSQLPQTERAPAAAPDLAGGVATVRRATARRLYAALRVPLAALLLLPVGGFLVANPSAASRVLVGGMFVAALLRPTDALLVLTALLILASPIGNLLHSAFRLDEPMLLAFLAGWLLHESITRSPGAPRARSTLAPAWWLAGIVAASVLTQLLVARAMEAFYWPYFRGVLAFLSGDYLASPGGLPAVDAGARMLEGIALFTAVVTLGARASLAPSIVRMAAVGAGGLATLNVVRYLAVRISHPGETAAALQGVRISILGDYNAVGSYLAMMLLVVVGLAVAGRRGRVAWIAAAGAIGTSLWLTRSRAALLAVGVGLLFFVAALAQARLRASWWKPVAAALLVMVALGALVARFAPPDAGLRPMINMAQGRLEMARVSVHLFESAPVFGVGVGRFWRLSGEYLGRSVAGVANENAHNNFLQILAELGAIGLLAFLWVLVAAARRLRPWLARDGHFVRIGCAAGLTAFLVTCLSGHPLLLRHACYAFWLMLGVTVAISPPVEAPQAEAHRPRRPGVLSVALLIGLAVSIPLRAASFLRNEADLRKVAIGFSDWRSDGRGRAYRTIAGRAHFFVGRDVCSLALPVRPDSDVTRQPIEVELRVDGRVANRIRLEPGVWHDIAMSLPPRRNDQRFHTIELRTLPGGEERVRVADIRATPCPRPLSP